MAEIWFDAYRDGVLLSFTEVLSYIQLPRYTAFEHGDRFTVVEGAEYVKKAAEEGYAYVSASL